MAVRPPRSITLQNVLFAARLSLPSRSTIVQRQFQFRSLNHGSSANFHVASYSPNSHPLKSNDTPETMESPNEPPSRHFVAESPGAVKSLGKSHSTGIDIATKDRIEELEKTVTSTGLQMRTFKEQVEILKAEKRDLVIQKGKLEDEYQILDAKNAELEADLRTAELQSWKQI